MVHILDAPKIKRPFKFFDFWANNPKFLEVVEHPWCSPVYGSPMFQLTTKLRRLKVDLRKFNQSAYSNLHDRVKDAELKMVEAQINLQLDPLDGSKIQEEAVLEYSNLRCDEESFLKQKSTVKWLELGHSNSKYFFNAVKAFHCKARINFVTSSNGNVLMGMMRLKLKLLTISKPSGVNLILFLSMPNS